ncbi:hypothetical protein ACROHD_20485, partial [Nioella aestuarii]
RNHSHDGNHANNALTIKEDQSDQASQANEIQRQMLEAAARRPRNRDELVDRQASKFRIPCNPAEWLLFIEYGYRWRQVGIASSFFSLHLRSGAKRRQGAFATDRTNHISLLCKEAVAWDP